MNTPATMHTLALTITQDYEHLRPSLNRLLAKLLHLELANPRSSYVGPQRLGARATVKFIERLFGHLGIPAEGYDALLSPSNHLPIQFGKRFAPRKRVDFGLVAQLLKEAARRIERGNHDDGSLMRRIRAASAELHARQESRLRSA